MLYICSTPCYDQFRVRDNPNKNEGGVEMKEITILKLEINKDLEVTKIPNDLQSKQKIVGGYIEHLQITENIGIILNEEGKLEQLEPTLLLLDKGGNILDYIAGNCFFVGIQPNNPNFVNLSEKSINYLKQNIKKLNKFDRVTGEHAGLIHTLNW